MPMYLTLVHREDELINQRLMFIRQRRELARSAVPEGFEDYFRRTRRRAALTVPCRLKATPLTSRPSNSQRWTTPQRITNTERRATPIAPIVWCETWLRMSRWKSMSAYCGC